MKSKRWKIKICLNAQIDCRWSKQTLIEIEFDSDGEDVVLYGTVARCLGERRRVEENKFID